MANLHAKKHYGSALEPSFYNKEFWPTFINELEFIRSPFYDLAKSEQLS